MMTIIMMMVVVVVVVMFRNGPAKIRNFMILMGLIFAIVISVTAFVGSSTEVPPNEIIDNNPKIFKEIPSVCKSPPLSFQQQQQKNADVNTEILTINNVDVWSSRNSKDTTNNNNNNNILYNQCLTIKFGIIDSIKDCEKPDNFSESQSTSSSPRMLLLPAFLNLNLNTYDPAIEKTTDINYDLSDSLVFMDENFLTFMQENAQTTFNVISSGKCFA